MFVLLIFYNSLHSIVAPGMIENYNEMIQEIELVIMVSEKNDSFKKIVNLHQPLVSKNKAPTI